MGMVELLVPMTAIIGSAVIIGLFTRLIATGIHHKTIREAIRHDPASVPVLTERLDARQPWADAMLGWIFIAFAVGLALLAITDPDANDRTAMLRATIIPLVIGVTVLIFIRMSRGKN